MRPKGLTLTGFKSDIITLLNVWVMTGLQEGIYNPLLTTVPETVTPELLDAIGIPIVKVDRNTYVTGRMVEPEESNTSWVNLAEELNQRCYIRSLTFSSVANASRKMGIPTYTARKLRNDAHLPSYLYYQCLGEPFSLTFDGEEVYNFHRAVREFMLSKVYDFEILPTDRVKDDLFEY